MELTQFTQNNPLYMKRLLKSWQLNQHLFFFFFQKIFQFWTDLGVDGFSLRDVNLLFEVEELNLNEPESELPGVKPVSYLDSFTVYSLLAQPCCLPLALCKETVKEFMHPKLLFIIFHSFLGKTQWQTNFLWLGLAVIIGMLTYQ